MPDLADDLTGDALAAAFEVALRGAVGPIAQGDNPEALPPPERPDI